MSDLPPSAKVLDEIAEREGVSPVDLEPPLYDVIDPEALDFLFRNHGRETVDSVRQIVFRYAGYDVSVSGDGEVGVEERKQRSDPVHGSATDAIDE